MIPGAAWGIFEGSVFSLGPRKGLLPTSARTGETGSDVNSVDPSIRRANCAHVTQLFQSRASRLLGRQLQRGLGSEVEFPA